MERLNAGATVAVAAPAAALPAESLPGDAPRPPRRWPLVALGVAALPLYGWAARLGDLMAHPAAFAT